MRSSHGSYDEVAEVHGLKVRHCNWVRFLRPSPLFTAEVNVVCSKVKGRFQWLNFVASIWTLSDQAMARILFRALRLGVPIKNCDFPRKTSVIHFYLFLFRGKQRPNRSSEAISMISKGFLYTLAL